ncbi:MAG: hypothetical protein ACK40X_10800, partial [Armatimonadota bacterium]
YNHGGEHFSVAACSLLPIYGARSLMSRSQDCFAVVSGYHSDNLNDPFKGQNSLYLSLLGDDLVIGSERTSHVRLQVSLLDEAMRKPLEL